MSVPAKIFLAGWLFIYLALAAALPARAAPTLDDVRAQIEAATAELNKVGAMIDEIEAASAEPLPEPEPPVIEPPPVPEPEPPEITKPSQPPAPLPPPVVDVPAREGFATTSQDGLWSDPATWGGTLPPAGADVQIIHNVVLDADATAASVLINGRLIWHPANAPVLTAGLVVVTGAVDFDLNDACNHQRHAPGGELIIGTEAAPGAGGIDLQLFSGQNAECAPGIISHGGKIQIHGVPVRSWANLAATAAAGSASVTLAEQPFGWQPGDKLLIVGTEKKSRASGRSPTGSYRTGPEIPTSETRTIVSIDGNTVTFDAPLQYAHQCDDWKCGEVANLSRSVVIRTAPDSAAPGHTMFHSAGSGGLHYAEFAGLGKPLVLGRYPIHFHKAGGTMRGFRVEGNSIHGSGNRWLVIHGTDGIAATNNVGYKSLGHGYFLEDGSEEYNLFAGNLAVQAYRAKPIPGQAIAHDRNAGDCFWSANARNWFIGNVAAECDNAGISFDYDDAPMLVTLRDGTPADARTISGGLVARFEGHTSGDWHIIVRGGDFPATEPLLFRDLRVWRGHYQIDLQNYANSVVFDGVKMSGSSYGMYHQWPGNWLARDFYCEHVSPHGCVMIYRGGFGMGLVDGMTVGPGVGIVSRMTGIGDTLGRSSRPVINHIRGLTLPPVERRNGWRWPALSGTEPGTTRADALTATVIHAAGQPQLFIMPEKQATMIAGLPGAEWQENGDRFGYPVSGRGNMRSTLTNIAWPDSPLSKLTDTRPPVSMISRVAQRPDGKIIVGGFCLDRSACTVTVNGIEATALPDGVGWVVEIDATPGMIEIIAQARDAEGNVEENPHIYPL